MEFKQGDEIEAYIYYDKNNILRASRNINLEANKIYSMPCIDVKKKWCIFSISGQNKVINAI